MMTDYYKAIFDVYKDNEIKSKIVGFTKRKKTTNFYKAYFNLKNWK
tara:strand:+ start:4992 stop:5129 length:138 start_codon:yes stop_codon:yes gene_type:complete